MSEDAVAVSLVRDRLVDGVRHDNGGDRHIADDRPLATENMSGTTSNVWQPNQLPVRPKPQTTSSASSRMSYLSSSRAISGNSRAVAR